MKRWICSDGGGTKLIMLLIDEELNIVRVSTAGGVNPNFTPEDHIRRNMAACAGAIRDACSGAIPEACYTSMPCPVFYLQDALKDAGIPAETVEVGEGLMGLLAGICRKEGLAALSGTGSDVFYVGKAGKYAVGGWGQMLGDEGSGGYIGQKGLIAVIRGIDGRSAPTALTDGVAEWLRADGRLEAGERATEQALRKVLIERIYHSPSPRAELASFAPYVSAACDRGDAAAADIIAEAGAEMGMQMTALIHRMLDIDPGTLQMHSTLCGGVWKGSRLLYKSYRAHVLGAFPRLDIQWPLFDAVAGGAALAGLSMGYKRDEIITRLLDTFRDYRYPAEKLTEVS